MAGVSDAVAARAGTECRGCTSEAVALTHGPGNVGEGRVGSCGGAGDETAGAGGSADRRSTRRLSQPEMAARANSRDPVSTTLVSARWPQVSTEAPATGI